MPRLSERHLAEFLDEVAAAVRADVPLGEAMERLEGNRLGWISRSARAFRSELEKGNSASRVLSKMHSRFGKQAAAAMETCEKTGDSTTLNHLSGHLRLRRRLRQESWIAWLYPILLIWVAFAVLVVPMRFVHTSSRLTYQANEPAVILPFLQEYSLPQLDELITGIGIGLAVLTVLFLIIKISISPRLSRPARNQLFCRALADQIDCGVDDQTAIANAAALADDHRLATRPPSSLSELPLKSLLAKSPIASVDVSVQGNLATAYRGLANAFGEQARRRAYIVSRVLPRVATALIGGTLVISYVMLVIVPVYLELWQ